MQIQMFFNKRTCQLLLIIFLTGSLWAASTASVRDEISGIATVDSLQKYYLDNRQNSYIMRYLVKYLPDYLSTRGIYSCPSWVEQLLSGALYSDYGPLIYEAVKAVGYFNLAEHTDRLVELFSLSQKKYLSFAPEIRGAVVTSLQQFGGSYQVSQLIALFNAYPVELISLDEFVLLVEALAHTKRRATDEIPVNEETFSVKISTCKKMIAVLDTEDSYGADQARKKYGKILSSLETIQKTIASTQGGTHE